jgi:hypothetical protein
LADELNVDIAFFVKDGPAWHVLNPSRPDIYIKSRYLAVQDQLKDKGKVRQFGVRLPLRVMHRFYIEAHVKEMVDSRSRDTLWAI